MAAVKSFTMRFTGDIAYTDGSKGAFAGLWDGKVLWSPTPNPHDDAAAAFNQTIVIRGFEEAVSNFGGANPTGSEATNPSFVFTFASSSSGSPPAYPGTKAAFKDMVLTLSGQVAYVDGTKGSYEASHQLKRNQSSPITSVHLTNLINDAPSLVIINNVLTAAAGFLLHAV